MKKASFYIIINIVFCLLIFLVIHKGQSLPNRNQHQIEDNRITEEFNFSTLDSARNILFHNLKNPISLLLLQIIIILAVSRLSGIIFKRVGQPLVIGEIIAGIILGPSVLGILFPHVKNFLFPAESFNSLQYLSQIGLTLFMFSIGMELDLNKIKNSKRDAVIISHAGILLPFFLGVLLAYFMYSEFAPANIRFVSFALFFGIAMSITAFPVLARILQEKGLSKTDLGVIAITCAAAGDVSAWCILAVVIAIVKAASLWSVVYTILLVLIFAGIMIYIVKPILERFSEKYFKRERIERHVTAITFIILLLSAFTAEVIGIHALFGAFIAGVIMPNQPRFRESIILKIEDISKIILLPIFFAFIGLRTQIGLLSTSHLWIYCGIIILVAVMGKLGGTAFTARFLGFKWKESFSLGILMNTRGLMELIVLNIGYDLGILSPAIFAMLVLMALATTFFTGPLLDIINMFSKK